MIKKDSSGPHHHHKVKSMVEQIFQPIIESLNKLSHKLKENPQDTIEEKHFNKHIDKWFQNEDIHKIYSPKKQSNNTSVQVIKKQNLSVTM